MCIRDRTQADQIILDARARAEAEQEKALERTRQEADSMLEKAKADIASCLLYTSRCV